EKDAAVPASADIVAGPQDCFVGERNRLSSRSSDRDVAGHLADAPGAFLRGRSGSCAHKDERHQQKLRTNNFGLRQHGTTMGCRWHRTRDATVFPLEVKFIGKI